MSAWDPIADAGRQAHARLLDALQRPSEQQGALLAQLLRTNADTQFGREHGFSSIRTLEDFRRSVPVRRDAEYRPWLDQVVSGQPRILTESRVVAIEATGGSTGAKLIPYTAESLAAFASGVLPWLHHLLTRFPRISDGLAYVAASPVTRMPTTLPCGLPLGLPSDAAYLGESLMPALSKVITAAPVSHDVAQWRIHTLAHLARRSDITLLSVWSPTFLLELLESLPSQAEAVLAALHDDREASRRLERALSATGRLGAALWPNLQVVSLWSDGASGPYARRVQSLLPEAFFDAKGVLATESVITTRIDDRLVPALTSAFLEFIDPSGSCRLAHELEEGILYRAVVTTPGGLYRYDIGDEFLCESMRDGIADLRFRGRVGTVSDLVGEKLTDSFVSQALSLLPLGAALVPRHSPDPHYELWLDGAEAASEAVVSAVEARLSENPQYAYARQIGQMKALRVVWSPGFARFRSLRQAAKGSRLGDVKPLALLIDASQLPPVVTDAAGNHP